MGPIDGPVSNLSEGLEVTGVPLTATVLIIGGGVTGLLSSILLAKHGIDSIVVEKYAQRLGQPKAHAINPRSLEILRQAGIDTIALRQRGMSPRDGDMVRFATSMSGLEFGNLPYERQEEDAKELTPEPLFNVSQPLLEQILTEAVEKQPLVSLKIPAEYKATDPFNANKGSESLWISSILDKNTGSDFQTLSKYILICDGANSTSRSKFDIPFSVLPGHPRETFHNVSVHFNADLRQFNSGTLWFFMRPTQRGTMICYNRQDSWVYVIRRRPEGEPKSMFTEEYCRTLVDDAIGQQIPYDVLSITHWTTMPQAADYYRSKLVPAAFLLGDAAHSFPPTGGLGLNTGIADAHNLVWKIHAVEAGWSSAAVLDTYSRERRPIAIANGHQSQINLRNLHKLLARTFAPEATDDQLINDLHFYECLNNAIENNRDHFDSINLQLGYVYGEVDAEKRQCYPYIPRCEPGARLPHIWVERNGLKCSSLDLVDGTSFVLIATQSFLRTEPILGEMKTISIPVMTLEFGVDFLAEESEWSAKMSFHHNDAKGILIRPDQHIVGIADRPSEVPLMLRRFFNA